MLSDDFFFQSKDHEFVVKTLNKMKPKIKIFERISKKSNVPMPTIVSIARGVVKDPRCGTIQILKDAIQSLRLNYIDHYSKPVTTKEEK